MTDAEKLEKIKRIYDKVTSLDARNQTSSHIRDNLEGALFDMDRTGTMDAVCRRTIRRCIKQLERIERVLGI